MSKKNKNKQLTLKINDWTLKIPSRTSIEKTWKDIFHSAGSYYDFDYYDYYEDKGEELGYTYNIRDLIVKHQFSKEEEDVIKQQVIAENNARRREPDYDLIAYLANNDDFYQEEDIYDIHAEVPGHNDEDHWHWIIELKDHTYVYTDAWCDYTGWDCSSGGNSIAADTIDNLMPHVEDIDIRQALIYQVLGRLPIGTQVIRNAYVNEEDE